MIPAKDWVSEAQGNRYEDAETWEAFIRKIQIDSLEAAIEVAGCNDCGEETERRIRALSGEA